MFEIVVPDAIEPIKFPLTRRTAMNKPKSSQIEALLASLYSRINYERQLRVTPKHFKLKNMRDFLRRLGDPHLQYPVVHVAGTKGKGSVATMIGQILSGAGRKTGVYSSPHLETIHQRMAIDGSIISDDQLVEVLAEIEPVAQQLDQEAEIENRRPLTFFEVTTAAAFCFFARQRADVVVLEVGLGGRLDSTNVCQPEVSVITNISFDHTKQLGNTLGKIAFEKAGIIKPLVPVISGVVTEEPAKVIAEVAAQHNAPLAVLENDFEVVEETAGPTFTVQGRMPSFDSLASSPSATPSVTKIPGLEFEISQLKLAMVGAHQRTNAAISIAAIESLNQRGWNISGQQIRNGLAKAQMPGRTEIVSQQPLVIIDIAHNVASAAALAHTLQELNRWQTASCRTLIFATSRDKDAVGMLKNLLPQFDCVVFTKYQNNPRGSDPQKLRRLADSLFDSNVLDSRQRPELRIDEHPEQAWDNTIAVVGGESNSRSDQAICIAGSAFLVAELRPVVLDSISQRQI